jgi:hypothetical protein
MWVPFFDKGFGDGYGSTLRIVWGSPPTLVNVTGNQVTVSMGDETILLPVAVNVTGQKIMALSVGPTIIMQSVYTTQTPALMSTINSELGVRVRFSHPGYIQTVRYYKIAGAPNGSRTVRLWNYSGQFQMASGGGSDDTGISNAWVNVGMVANVQAGVDYIISINNPGIYGYSNAPPWPVVNGNISLVYSYYAPAGQGNFPDSTLGQDIFLDPQFYAVGAEETVNTGASLTAATNLLTTTVGNESVAIPVLVNATTNLISTTTGTVTLPRLVPVTTNVATTSVNSVTVSLPKQVNASTNVITVSDGIVTATTRTDVSTALTGQSVTAYVGLEGAGSARPGDAWDWQSAVPIGLDLTNSDMTVDAPNAISAGYIKSTTAWDTGKHYVEVTITGSALNLRVGPANIPLTGGAVLHSTGFVNAEGDDGTMPALVPGDVVGIAYNAEAGKVWFRINGGNWNNDPTQAPY